MRELRLIALNGFLGYGYELVSLERGIEARPHCIAADAGSTDPGPFYLGSGEELVKAAQIYRDFRFALLKARQIGVPLIIGSAGTAGGEPHLQSLLEVVHRCAREDGLHFKLAVIHAEIPKETVREALRQGRIEPMPGVGALSEEALEGTVRIVAQMGTVPFIRALSAGAEVVIAGRACDTALYAALPLMHGFDPALAFHLAKIIECGALCARPMAAGDSMLGTIRNDHFTIQALNPKRVVTPLSVAEHSLYEQPNPNSFEEPEGIVDISEANYEKLDEHTVRVSGSRYTAREKGPTIKLEGVCQRGYRAVTFAGIRDFSVIEHLEDIEQEVRGMVERNLQTDDSDSRYDLYFRYYGRDGVLGLRESLRRQPVHEVGVLIEAIAPNQELAGAVLSLARSSFLHCSFPGRKTTAGNLAFPFSPSDLQAGGVYAFSIYHILHGADQNELFPIDFQTL